MGRIPTDPDLGPVLSLVVVLLIFSIVFLVGTLPFSSILHSDPGVIGGAIGALVGVLGIAITARRRLDGKGPR